MTAPVLVTGLGRSGTTWVGRMLCLSGELNYLHEPFGFHRAAKRWPAPHLPSRSFYICRDNEAEYYQRVADVIRMRYPVRNRLAEIRAQGGTLAPTRERLRLAWRYAHSLYARALGRAPLLKDPNSFFSAPWLAERFGVRVVLNVRHPAAVASSFKRLGWKVNFRHWRDQPLLMRDHLGPFAAELEEHCRELQDPLSQAALLWKMYYSVGRRFREGHPDWVFVKYEELAADPVEGFRELYGRLGLRWGAGVRRRIDGFTRPGNLREDSPKNIWSVSRDSRATRGLWAERLSPDEVEFVRRRVEEVSRWYYTDAEWQP